MNLTKEAIFDINVEFIIFFTKIANKYLLFNHSIFQIVSALINNILVLFISSNMYNKVKISKHNKYSPPRKQTPHSPNVIAESS